MDFYVREIYNPPDTRPTYIEILYYLFRITFVQHHISILRNETTLFFLDDYVYLKCCNKVLSTVHMCFFLVIIYLSLKMNVISFFHFDYIDYISPSLILLPRRVPSTIIDLPYDAFLTTSLPTQDVELTLVNVTDICT